MSWQSEASQTEQIGTNDAHWMTSPISEPRLSSSWALWENKSICVALTACTQDVRRHAATDGPTGTPTSAQRWQGVQMNSIPSTYVCLARVDTDAQTPNLRAVTQRDNVTDSRQMTFTTGEFNCVQKLLSSCFRPEFCHVLVLQTEPQFLISRCRSGDRSCSKWYMI